MCILFREREREKREREGWLEQVKVYSNRLGISRVKRVVRLQLGGGRTCLPMHKKPWLHDEAASHGTSNTPTCVVQLLLA